MVLQRKRAKQTIERDRQERERERERERESYTLNDSLNWLRQLFPDRLISRRCDPEWVPHSPDLNPPDFYLWGYLKDNPQTIPDIKAATAAKIRAIPREECARVIQNFACRVQVCLQRGGAHLEHILERQ